MILEQCNLAATVKSIEGGYLLHIFYIWGSLFWLLGWSLNRITGLDREVEHVWRRD